MCVYACACVFMCVYISNSACASALLKLSGKVMVLCSGHTSHVTRHTSHVTHHTSHVTHHTSHITHHTSQVIGVFRGPARVFDREKDAFDAVMAGNIKRGDVMVIRYEGPKGY